MVGAVLDMRQDPDSMIRLLKVRAFLQWQMPAGMALLCDAAIIFS